MPADERLEPLMDAYIAAWTAIQTRQDRILTLPSSRRPAATRALERFTLESMDKLDEFTEQFLKAEFPGVYKEGGRLAARRMGVPYQFDSSDRAAVQKLQGDLFDDLLSKTKFVRKDVKRAIGRMLKDELVMGRASGKTVAPMRDELVKRLKKNGIQGVRYRNGRYVRLDTYAEMALRTKAGFANNISGIEFGRKYNIEFYECLDGPLCVAPDSKFQVIGDLVALYRARYSGPMYTITASPDYRITVGPNHPVLTRRGWVAASEITEGDELVHEAGLKVVSRLSDPDLEDVPTIADVFDLALELGSPTVNTSANRDDFHGDGDCLEGEVQVINTAGSLLLKSNPMLSQELGESNFVGANAPLSGEPSLSALFHSLNGGGSPSNGIMGRSRASLSSFGALLGCIEFGGFRTSSSGNPSTFENVENVRGCNSVHDPNFGGAEACQITAADSLVVQPSITKVAAGVGTKSSFAGGLRGKDGPANFAGGLTAHVVDIQISHYEGWVYDATTSTGAYSVGDIIVHNCGLYGHNEGPLASGLVLPAEQALEFPLSHPNCRRIWTPRPDIKTAEEAAGAEPSVTEEQLADQRKFDAERAAAQRRRNLSRRKREQALERRRRRVA